MLIAEALTHRYANAPDGQPALAQLSLTAQPREFVSVIGPSGCGKSTLLKLLAGLITPTTGRVLFDGRPLTRPDPRISLVFQKANLMPWRTVLANVCLPLELRHTPPAEARARALALIELVGLSGFEHVYPRDLSGGMEQRAALARALITQAEVLLLDEPFGALDALTRERMGTELLRIWEARRTTVVLVTHSLQEALRLSDRVVVLTPRPGQVQLTLSVPLPRPRGPEIEHSADFGALAAELRAAIR